MICASDRCSLCIGAELAPAACAGFSGARFCRLPPRIGGGRDRAGRRADSARRATAAATTRRTFGAAAMVASWQAAPALLAVADRALPAAGRFDVRAGRSIRALSAGIDRCLALVGQGRRILPADFAGKRRHRLDQPVDADAIGDRHLGRRGIAHGRRRIPPRASRRSEYVRGGGRAVRRKRSARRDPRRARLVARRSGQRLRQPPARTGCLCELRSASRHRDATIRSSRSIIVSAPMRT